MPSTPQLRYRTVTALSDLGHQDEFVGLIHSIIADRCGSVKVIDLCHEIAPGDVRAAALMLARSVAHLAPGVVIASVGRRLERPAIAVSVGEGQSVLVGPDNGVLAGAVAAVGGADCAVQLGLDESNSKERLAGTATDPAVIHPARDILAPAAARLCLGEPLEALGEPIDPAALTPAVIAVPRTEEDGSVIAEVIAVDRSGIAQLNVDASILATLAALTAGRDGPKPQAISVSFGSEARIADLAAPLTESLTESLTAPNTAPPAEPAPGRLLLAADPHALIEVIAGGAETAADIGLRVGTEVRLQPLDDPNENPTAQPVQLTKPTR